MWNYCEGFIKFIKPLNRQSETTQLDSLPHIHSKNVLRTSLRERERDLSGERTNERLGENNERLSLLQIRNLNLHQNNSSMYEALAQLVPYAVFGRLGFI